ncbi:TPA: phage tail protein [Salmonella enterica subsp. enterica serovar Napoli]|uniref:Phage tail protein n=3 Tax=Salmonella enterica TaxID=28901 RepID=A0A2C9NUX8_SALET|nr:phage tail protein [Salmonella enterica subsp. enterica serovar Macclesfield str. S-1643]EBI6080079.1 phage tail protein [Salmonella enterica]EBX4297702.1 phage tail protein [Salmonella enterica subsp. enterica serovar Napoli]ECI2499208.1 phage tail protein [Salmonella enterica subsp. enterica serovar Enteritidis]EDW8759008.1 phage tail protein [Salmonella enterica subsp. enterica]HDP0188913.1 phage tail protein [Salmonella enterica subsp. enterica serovar Concord]
MADYYSIITNRGKELEAEALASGRLIVLTHFVVGDSNGKQVRPDPAQIRLINETYRGDIAELVVSPEQSTQLMAKIVLPTGIGGFTVREVGLMTDAGDLYAVANCPSIDKPVGGVSVNMQFRLAVSDTSNITLNVATGDGLFLRIDQNLKEIKSRGAEAQKTSRESIGVLDGTTQQRGLVQLSSSVNSTSETQAATPAAVKIVMDNANARLAKDRNGADIPNVALFLQNLGLGETINRAADALQKSQNGGDIPDKGLFAQNIGAALAFSGGIHIGGDSNPWTTAEFIAWLESQGAFNHRYWMCRGSWSYADNKTITDTGCGNICLAGAVVEVMGFRGATTIRVTTPTTTSGGGVASAQFTYIDNGGDYSPGWRRDFNTINKPTAGDVGALPVTGGRLNGPLGIGTDNGLGGNSIVLGDNDTGFKQDGDGILGIYANNARVGYIDNSGLHMSVDIFTNGGIRAGDGKRLSLTSNNNSTMTATFNLWGDVNRPTVIELDDDQGWQFYSQRNTDGSISFRVNGQMEPNSYSNFDSRYVQDIRLGSLQYGQVWNGPGFSDTSGYVITGIINGNSDELIDGAHRRPIQKLIGNQWYNVVSI